MTNYEKYKNEIIKMLVSSVSTCNKIWQFRTGSEDAKCPFYTSSFSGKYCKECESLNEQWLNEEINVFDPYKLKEGDKIIMRKYVNTEFSEFEVVCNRFPYCWLRFRDSENGTYRADDDFLIFYDDLLDKYELREVIRE